MSRKKQTPHDENRPLGYKNPPKNTQFKAGNPGGPGRPKGATNATGILNKMLNGKVPVTENGKRVNKPMAEAMARRGQQLALTGSHTAFFRALELFDKHGLTEEPAQPLGDVEALGQDMLAIFVSILDKTIAYREVEAGEPVKPADREFRDMVVGKWEFSFGDDGHIQVKRCE